MWSRYLARLAGVALTTSRSGGARVVAFARPTTTAGAIGDFPGDSRRDNPDAYETGVGRGTAAWAQ